MFNSSLEDNVLVVEVKNHKTEIFMEDESIVFKLDDFGGQFVDEIVLHDQRCSAHLSDMSMHTLEFITDEYLEMDDEQKERSILVLLSMVGVTHDLCEH
jgi:hypothetical protein